MPANLSDKKLHKIARIDRIVRDFFKEHPLTMEIPAKELMKKFVEKGIFLRDDRSGTPIRNLLNYLERDKQLHLLQHVKAGRPVKKAWYFMQLDQLPSISSKEPSVTILSL